MFEQKYEKYQSFYLKIFSHLEVKFPVYLNRRVFVMIRGFSSLLLLVPWEAVLRDCSISCVSVLIFSLINSAAEIEFPDRLIFDDPILAKYPFVTEASQLKKNNNNCFCYTYVYIRPFQTPL